MPRMMKPEEVAEAKASGLRVVMKAGPLRNGNELGHGSVWHLAPGNEWDGRRALCGAQPAIQWSSWRPQGQQATCPKCIRLDGGTRPDVNPRETPAIRNGS